MIPLLPPGLTYYECTHFRIEELVSPEIFEKYGNRAWQFFSPYLLYGIDLLREEFGPITVNDWLWGGGFTQSGLRSFDFDDSMSLHKLGKGMDLKFGEGHDIECVQADIVNQPEKYWMFTATELGTETWLHVDTRNVDTTDGMYTFSK